MDSSRFIGEATTYDKKLKLEKKKPLSWLERLSALLTGPLSGTGGFSPSSA